MFVDTNRLFTEDPFHSLHEQHYEEPAVKASSSHLVVLSGGVLDDLHRGRQRGVSLLVLLLLAAALHPRGRLGEEVAIFAEDSLKETVQMLSTLLNATLFITKNFLSRTKL